MAAASVISGSERFVFEYQALAHQLAFHHSPLPHRLLGGAAGPGKTLALIMDHLLHCQRFSIQEAPQVHTLLLRRTHPKLAATVITRFREKVPRELYKDFNESKYVVTWLNGATTQFGSMQHEHDVWGWQGQWYKIGYDELTEFTFNQWENISAWNRCPVSPHATKDGATNPIGPGARWVESLFVKKKPCAEMDENQRKEYAASDFGYFPATYRDNPIYANDPTYVKNLNKYRGPVAQALKEGIWGVAGGYFDGAWDEAENVYGQHSIQLEPWWKRWMGGDWGFEHNSAIYWYCLDDLGIARIYRELVCNKHTPEELAERIASMSIDAEGNRENIQFFAFAHDAFAQRQDANPIAIRMGRVLKAAGLPEPFASTKDKKGREQIIYDRLKQRVRVGQTFNDALGKTDYVEAAALQISDACPELIGVLPTAPRDPDNSEEIQEFLGDDPIAGCGYGLYAMFGKPNSVPYETRVVTRLNALAPEIDMSQRMVHREKIMHEERKKTPGPIRMRRPTRWARN